MNSRMTELTKKRQDMMKHMNFYRRSILRGKSICIFYEVCSGFEGIEGSG